MDSRSMSNMALIVWIDNGAHRNKISSNTGEGNFGRRFNREWFRYNMRTSLLDLCPTFSIIKVNSPTDVKIIPKLIFSHYFL